MSCDAFESLMPAFLEGELAASRRREVAAHLETCPGCRRALAHFREIDTVLVSRRLEVPPLEGSLTLVRPLMRRRRLQNLLHGVLSVPFLSSATFLLAGVILLARKERLVWLLRGLLRWLDGTLGAEPSAVDGVVGLELWSLIAVTVALAGVTLAVTLALSRRYLER